MMRLIDGNLLSVKTEIQASRTKAAVLTVLQTVLRCGGISKLYVMYRAAAMRKRVNPRMFVQPGWCNVCFIKSGFEMRKLHFSWDVCTSL